MHCQMIMVWCKYEQNRTNAIKVIEQNPKMLMEGWNDGHAENSIPPKTPFCGEYNKVPSKDWSDCKEADTNKVPSKDSGKTARKLLPIKCPAKTGQTARKLLPIKCPTTTLVRLRGNYYQ